MADSKDSEGSGYRAFWNRVGAEFPDLGGAVSTGYYRDCEQLLFEDHLEPLEGKRVFKTDLWDEARNTRILQWAAGRGASVFGLDLSPATAIGAVAEFERLGAKIEGVVSDIRRVPYRDECFDAVYSMGTVEHFDETEEAIREIFRVVRPGGRAVIGVPNRRDPFLRPLMVWVLNRLGLYGYGFEKSYSAATLRRMLEQAGFEVVAETGILFIPGWLRMLDLAFHSWCRPLARGTGLAVRPFAWAYRRFPRLRRHGYLIAAVGVRP